MAEMILPGTYIEVRAERLIAPGPVSVGNLGVVGTASKGPIGVPTILSSYADTQEKFGRYDPWIDGQSDELTLVRALEQAYLQGATTVFAVRVANGAQKSQYTLNSSNGACVTLQAKTEGTWGDELKVNVWDADEHPFIEDEEHTGGGPITLNHTPVVKSARNRIRHFIDATGVTKSLKILYDDDPAAPASGEVKINRATGALTFGDGDPAAADVVTAFYTVDMSSAVKVTLQLGTSEEVYNVVSGDDLIDDLARLSAWVDGVAETFSSELPLKSSGANHFAQFSGGDNGATGANYQEGLDKLLNENAHIILAAGQDESFGDELAAHCKAASSDAYQRERIAVVGSKVGATLDDIRGHNLNSDRLIYVAPGIKATDAAASPPVEVVLPGAYTAAAIAGLLSSLSAHFSPTNKVVSVGGLEQRFNSAELAQLVQSRVLVLEERLGIKIVKGITTSTDSAWHQITTRRIVDYAKFGVRSAANPFIGKLNNARVREALKGSINSLLADMVDLEMLIAYELDVSATRDQEIRGIAQVVMTLQPTFSIDFIRVTMFLQ
ncbi:MAG: hypothetical protein Kow0042_26140 [Calditrichia bacterium]